MTKILYRIPDLLSLFPRHYRHRAKPINPHFTEVDEAFTTWVNSSSFSPARKEGWLTAEMPLLAALAYPHANATQLRVCLDYMLLSLVLEELTDTSSSVHSQKWADTFIGFLRGTDPSNDFSQDESNPIVAMMKQISPRLMESLGPNYRAPFIAVNAVFARGMVQESLNREKYIDERHLTLESYIQTRRTTIGVAPVLVLAWWSRDIDLSDEILKLPDLQEMMEATLDMIYLANDIYSYKKERATNAAQHNCITVAMTDPSTGILDGDLQGSINYTANRIKTALRRFEECKGNLLNSPFQQDDRNIVEKYVESMMDWVVGNIEWSLASRRYGIFESEGGVVKFTIPRVEV